MKKLLLVDGSWYLYRAFHALPDLRTRSGQPTGAIYGVINMLRRLYAEQTPEHCVCVFDAAGPSFRHNWHPGYKANRAAMPEALSAQITLLQKIIRALGWPLWIEADVEADDVIGTLATRAAAEGMSVVVSSGDKDMCQLVRPGICILNAVSHELLDESGIHAKYGVPPNRIVDYLALTGDAVDNVPGVPGVGPKTAAKWLHHFGDLSTLMANAETIGGAVGQKLRETLDWLPVARQLITIRCDLALSYDWSTLTLQAADQPTLLDAFQRCEFRKWYEAIATNMTTSTAAPTEIREETRQTCYTLILSKTQLDDWLAQLYSAEVTAIDTETNSLDPLQAKLIGLSFSIQPNEGVYLPLGHTYDGAPTQLPMEAVLETLRPWLESDAYPKLGQNLKYDRHVLANHGIALNGIVDDSLLQSYLLASHERHNLDDQAKRVLDIRTTTYTDLTGKGARQIPFSQVDIVAAGRYAAADADIARQLSVAHNQRLRAIPPLDKLYRTIELPVASVLFRMERHGVLIDPSSLQAQSQALGERLSALEQQAYALAGQTFNLQSPKQLQYILFDQLGLSTQGVRKTSSGGYSTDEEVLQHLAALHPLPTLLLETRQLSKLKSTYTDKLPLMINPNSGRIHTHYAQATAVTGRLASSDPNLQNIPIRTPEGKRIRQAFIAPLGALLVSADYSQIELRIMAHLSQDAGLCRAFQQREDIHRATAAEVFGVPVAAVSSEQRRYAKSINFGLIYGMSSFGLAAQMETDRETASHFIQRYFERYPGVKAYMDRTRSEAAEQGYVATLLGRRLWLPDIRSPNATRRLAAERAAVNAPMQGTAADLIKLAMMAVDDWLQAAHMRSRLVLQVHDELVLEVVEEEQEEILQTLPAKMAGVAQLRVPLIAEVGSGLNWEVAHS